jgi:hypothetical protein
VLHLEQGKVKWSQEQEKLINKDVVVALAVEAGSNTEGLFQVMQDHR